MQAFSPFSDNNVIMSGMNSGRPAKTKRSPFGERLFHAREKKGLSQMQVADMLNIPYQTYANWERRHVAIKPDDLAKLANALDTTVNILLGSQSKTNKQFGPVGKARKLFEQVSNLPRYQQQRILGMIEDMLLAHEAKKVS